MGLFGSKDKKAEEIVAQLNDLPITPATQAKRDKLVEKLAQVADVPYTKGEVTYNGKPVTRPGSVRDRSKKS
jgi:hypothetical protein